ncbi:uncharacterized protein LOC143720442 [Siphateles boraxobius]|uniref:uncharacterized protein LOC143720442 n=1 Tax=Siphateles boraxobius TaxID=180520 RepID=UPI0040627BFC
MNQEPEPTVDWENEPTTKTAPELKPEAVFVLHPEPHREPDQVREPAKPSVQVGILVEYEGMDESPAYTSAAERELCQVYIECFEELVEVIPLSLLSSLVPPSSKSPATLMVPPPLPKQASPLAPPPLVSFSSSAFPLFSPFCCANPPWPIRSLASP